MPGGCWRLKLADASTGNEVVSCLYIHFTDMTDMTSFFKLVYSKEANSLRIGMMSYPCGKYERITHSHLFQSVNHTCIILTLDIAYQTKEKSCKVNTGRATDRCMNQT